MAPAFFVALQQHLPEIRAVSVQLKQGRHSNELSRFNAVCYFACAVASAADPYSGGVVGAEGFEPPAPSL